MITPSTDLYSLGVMLYEMLIGQVPISGDNYNQLMYRVMTGEYAPPRQLRPEIPEELERLIVHAMAADPSHRPRSAEEFEQALVVFCGPTFREHQVARPSASGFTPMFTPPPMTKSEQMYSGTARTVAADVPQKSKKGLIIGVIAMLAVGGGIAAAVIASSSPKIDPVVATPTPAPVVTPPPAPPVAAPPPKPAQVMVKFAITPSDALVQIDGKKLDGDLTVDPDTATHKLHVEAPGYAPHDEDIHFDITQRISIELVKQATVTKANPKQPPVGKPKKPTGKIENESPY